jgi:hypothetical protein
VSNYEYMKMIFQKYMQIKDGPFRLDVKTLANAYILEQARNDDIQPIKLDKPTMTPIWREMVHELCPYQLQIPEDFKILPSINEVDDNKNFIYTSSRSLSDHSMRLLNVSHPTIVSMLRIKYAK